ncbi:MAG: hypothetical protein AVDCRST_MAG32-1448 [uncultured Nocardioides sp.]|uniref:Lipoprotein n=1 Tax=uncultured Nocardioides sp. TaxID=198441 RepID=A0A6J4N6P2_9ACTN|nr:MAG: hypothetical protein AVDCRST_MAG32-1448 [uncultured Nocardioides sp.]
MTTPVRRRMRSSSVALGITAVMASNLTGCASAEESPDYAAVCVDPETKERVDDDQCDDDGDYNGVGGGFFWYYLGASSRFPAVGSTVTGGTFSTPRGSIQRGGLPSTGGSSVKSSTTKGGFGGSNRGFGG